jgi:hypothetical protein
MSWRKYLSRNGISSKYLETVKDGIASWFAKYNVSFEELAIMERSVNVALLKFYNVPSMIIAPHRDLIMLSAEAVTGYGGVGAELDRLRRDGFVSSVMAEMTIQVINERGAILDVSWERSYSDGHSETVRAAYVISGALEDWRIAAVLPYFS